MTDMELFVYPALAFADASKRNQLPALYRRGNRVLEMFPLDAFDPFQLVTW